MCRLYGGLLVWLMLMETSPSAVYNVTDGKVLIIDR